MESDTRTRVVAKKERGDLQRSMNGVYDGTLDS